MYSKEEVVELFAKFHKEKLSLYDFNPFLKEKGLIEEQFEDGWYRFTGMNTGKHSFYYINEDKTNYGISCINGWVENLNLSIDHKNMSKATPKEVEEALIKEAKKRGFKKGAKFIGLRGAVEIICSYNPKLLVDTKDCLVCGEDYIFNYRNDGKWAEIVEEKKEEIDFNTPEWREFANEMKADLDVLMRNKKITRIITDAVKEIGETYIKK